MSIVAQLTIAIDDKGSVSVTGPLDQLMFCYGMLEMAKDTLRNHQEEVRRRHVQPATVSDLKLVKQ